MVELQREGGHLAHVSVLEHDTETQNSADSCLSMGMNDYWCGGVKG